MLLGKQLKNTIFFDNYVLKILVLILDENTYSYSYLNYKKKKTK